MADSDLRAHLEAVEMTRRRRERVAIVVVALLIVALTLLEVRLSRFASEGPVANHLLFFALINVNVILTLLLGFLVFRNLAKLLFDRRRDRIGARLRTRLVIAFVAFTLAPSILLFSVSAGFVVNSIDKWFGPRAEQSLKEALDVATIYYQRLEDDATRYAAQIASEVSVSEGVVVSGPALEALVIAKRQEYDLAMIEVLSDTRVELARVSDPAVPVTSFSSADADFIARGLSGQTASRVQTVEVEEHQADVIRGIAPISVGDAGPVGVVVVNYYVPESLTSQMEEIYGGVAEFRQLNDYLSPIRFVYVVVLATITLLVIFSATWLGFYMSREITDPLRDLARATQAVAAGDLAVQIPEGGNDEIGVVVSGFNKMTGNLRANRADLERVNESLRLAGDESERRRQYLETVLENVAAGVIALDRDGRLTAVNEAAARLLAIDADEALGRGYRELLPDELVSTALQMFREADASSHAVTRELQVSLRGEARTLVVTVSALRDAGAERIGLVAVLDDLTDLVKAQRAAAWREVARRIAHEIKNPLTPIALSAQRLRRRFRERVADEATDVDVFDECTETIVRQVDELKRLVSEFSEFARLPEANPTPNSLNETISEAVALYRDAHAGVEVTFEPDESVPVFDLDREQIKRVAINLLDNAVAAVLENDGGHVTVRTTFEEALRIARLEVADDGPGITPEARERLFEPYFSTKKEGTGLGLAIVRRIVRDHDGFIRAQANDPTGTRFIVELPVKRARGDAPSKDEESAA